MFPTVPDVILQGAAVSGVVMGRGIRSAIAKTRQYSQIDQVHFGALFRPLLPHDRNLKIENKRILFQPTERLVETRRAAKVGKRTTGATGATGA